MSDHVRSGELLATRRNLYGWTIVVAIGFLIISLVFEFCVERYPMSGVHWDAPVYLRQAKRFSEGGYFEFYREKASLISDSLTGKTKNNDGWEYWRFARMGHIALSGTIVSIAGTDERSIFVLTWAYRLLLAGGVAFTVMLALELTYSSAMERSRWTIPIAALLSLALFLLSDGARYMSGNLVTEVPGLSLLSASGWLLLRSFKLRSYLRAAGSGFLAFLLYVAAIDSIWSYLVLLSLVGWYMATPSQGQVSGLWWQGVVTVATAAIIPFIIYSVYFFPLTDPRLMLKFANMSFDQHVTNQLTLGPVMLGIAQRLTTAVGFLFVGVALVIPVLTRSRVARFVAIWFVLVAALPASIALTSGSLAEVRKYFLCVPAAFALSILGWTNFIKWLRSERTKRIGDGARSVEGMEFSAIRSVRFGAGMSAMVLVLAGLAMISWSGSYEWLRSQPGLWRLKDVRAWMVVPKYERVDYQLPDLFRISRFVQELEGAPVVIASPGMQGGDHQHIIEYLNPRSDHEGVNMTPGSRVRVIEGQGEGDVDRLRKGGLQQREHVLLLKKRGEEWPTTAWRCCAERKLSLETDHFVLEELLPN